MKKIIPFVLVPFAGLGALIFVLLKMDTEPMDERSPASATENYELLKACEKQKILWENIEATAHKELPSYNKFGLPQLIAMSRQGVAAKGQLISDFAPTGWKKYLHRRGAIAKVKIVPRSNRYTGAFQGAECALLRLSLTYRPVESRPVAPGLALKVLRDRIPSANISALVSLDGQGKDFNFFKNPMSNIVPIGGDLGQKLVSKIFRSVSNYPEEMLADDLAATNSSESQVTAPRQLFFVPAVGSNFSSDEHDVRDDFAAIPEGTLVYRILALSGRHADFDYSAYTHETAAAFLKETEHVADIVTTSKFVASSFGDDGIFFKHQLRR